MKENIFNNDLSSYIHAELNDLSIAEALAAWLTLNFPKVHISFYDDPPKLKTDNPEETWVASKLERLKRSLEAAERHLIRLKLELDVVNDLEDIAKQKSAVKQLSRSAIRFHSVYSSKINYSGIDLEQLWKKNVKNRVQPVSFYLVFEKGKVEKVNKRVYPDRSIEHTVTHISICKSSISSKVKFFKSFNLDGKLGQGSSNIASLDQGQLIVSSSKQIWIS